MGTEKALRFLRKHGLEPEQIDPAAESDNMLCDMEAGLCGDVMSMPMIPTYLSNDGAVPRGVPAAVIDAGGTNFRTALVTFETEGCRIEKLERSKMPGIDSPCTWDEFIAFAADRIEPLMDSAELIGFCFSYSAEITPEIDGRVIRIDKEVVITGSEGKLLGASLKLELERRGFKNKRIVVLNDTVAVLLGGASTLDKSAFGGFIGQVSGTGTNTCVSLPCRAIPKLGMDSDRGMLVNLESGLYTGIRGGNIDSLLDRESHNPGSKVFEKLTAGVYLGELCRLTLITAADERHLCSASAERIRLLQSLDGADVDAWSRGERLDEICACPEDMEFVRAVSLAILRRSARCMCVNLLALARLTAQGTDAARPICVCAEGSLVDKCDNYRSELLELLEKYGVGKLGIHIKLIVGRNTTLSGSAAAALLN